MAAFISKLSFYNHMITRILNIAGFACLVSMMVWILTDVLSGIFNWGLPAMVDWVEVLNVICITLPLPYVTLNRKHIYITLLTERVSRKVLWVMDLITLIMFLCFTSILAWQLTIEAQYSAQTWEHTDVGWVVYWFPAKIALAFSFGFSALILFGQIIGHLVVRKR